jgi:hypothetical protein
MYIYRQHTKGVSDTKHIKNKMFCQTDNSIGTKCLECSKLRKKTSCICDRLGNNKVVGTIKGHMSYDSIDV